MHSISAHVYLSFNVLITLTHYVFKRIGCSVWNAFMAYLQWQYFTLEM